MKTPKQYLIDLARQNFIIILKDNHESYYSFIGMDLYEDGSALPLESFSDNMVHKVDGYIISEAYILSHKQLSSLLTEGLERNSYFMENLCPHWINPTSYRELLSIAEHCILNSLIYLNYSITRDSLGNLWINANGDEFPFSMYNHYFSFIKEGMEFHKIELI